ncbi:hypothetical protein D9Q98_005668 [Chlorella vulgaris]|uniref:J domain-containing protein n=1 Tax=Chlorella vulgaris TaxID=3077 RepID=A0A9D4TMG3_CHLVU|nr:hypothetical protein D9Q98_005668 [Chlorella vulgaris]
MGTRGADPFITLGLPRTASKHDVKQAFRRLALQCHPDVDPSPLAAQRFSDVKRAADVLLKQHGAGSNSNPINARRAWHTYTGAADVPHDWGLLRSRHTALALCAASLVAGFAILGGALASHDTMTGSNSSGQQLVRVMMQERQQLLQQRRHAGRRLDDDNG